MLATLVQGATLAHFARRLFPTRIALGEGAIIW